MSHLISSWVNEVELNYDGFSGQSDDSIDDIHLYVVK